MTDLTHAVQFFQTGYTILLALAFGEAFKQFVPDGDTNIRWDRFPSLLAFLFLIFPFFHGMSRYFYTTYLHTTNEKLAPVAFYVMLDGMVFMTMAAFFFVMSRSLSPTHWKRFYLTLLTLLAVDSGWIGVALFRHVPVLPWPHLFRTAGASTSALLVGDLPHLGSALLGHSDPRITEEHYRRVSSIKAAKTYSSIIRGLGTTDGHGDRS